MRATVVFEKELIKVPDNNHLASGSVLRIEPVATQLTTVGKLFNYFGRMTGAMPVELVTNLDHYIHRPSRQ